MDSIQLNGFSVEILGYFGPIEKVIYKDSNYYAMEDGTEYKIRLTNTHNVKVDAHVWIDGKKIGVWRIKPHGRVTVERPANLSRKFTLLSERSQHEKYPNLRINKNLHGLIKVTFRPEVEDKLYGNMRHGYDKEYIYSSSLPMCNSYSDTVTPHTRYNRNCITKAQVYENSIMDRYGPAGTGVGDYSHQRFNRVTPISDIDYDNITTIYTRLVVDNDQSTYRRKYLGLREATQVSRPPPSIELDHPSRPHTCAGNSKLTLSGKYYFDTF